MGSLKDVQETWEALARDDPMWAALMDPAKSGRRWGLEDFLATGRAEIATVLDHVASAGASPDFSGEALDFGCGIGRLTQALAERFGSATGVDISATMIELAEESNRRPDACRYVLNDSDDLAKFADGRFTFIYTSIVLQHVPSQYSTRYLREFARVLAPGGILVFQLPDRPSLRERSAQTLYALRKGLRIRSRVNNALRRLHLRSGGVTGHVPEAEMHCIREADVRRILEAEDLRIVDVQLTNSTDVEFSGNLRYLDAEPERGFVSKQYCAVRPGPG